MSHSTRMWRRPFGQNSLRLVIVIVVLQSWATFAKPSPKAMSSLENLVKEGVVPDVIDEKPSSALKVEWASGVSAEQGNELTPTQVREQPKVSWQAEADKLYLLAMVDPDAPSRADPKMREIAHLVIANIPGNDISKGDTLFEYIGSGAPQGSGLHRYVWLLFEQKTKVTSSIKVSKSSRKNRVNFSIRKFAREHDLGPLVAANFFQAQYDESVPLLYKQLSQE